MKTIIILAAVFGLSACGHKGSNDNTSTAGAPIASTVTPQKQATPTSMECLQNSVFDFQNGQYLSLDGSVASCLVYHDLFPMDGYYQGSHITDCETWSAAVGVTYLPVRIGSSSFCYAQIGIDQFMDLSAIAPDYSDMGQWSTKPPVVSECTPDVDCSADVRCVNTLSRGLTDGKALQICFP